MGAPRAIAGGGGARRVGSLLAGLLVALALAGCGSTHADAGKPGNPEKPEKPGYRRVLPPVAFELMVDAPAMRVLDVRTPKEYEGPKGHLQRATSLPLADLEARLPEIAYLREQTFLVYCDGGDDECGRRAMGFFVSHGFQDAILMAGGIDAWIADGFGTVGRGPQMSMPEDQGLRISKDPGGAGEKDLPRPP